MLNDRITQDEREKIYNEVWTEPVIKVAQRYNLSDNGLRKKCRKYWIPLPYPGYWAKIYAGHVDVPKAKLPEVRGELRNLVTNYILKLRPEIERISDEDLLDLRTLIVFTDETNSIIKKICDELVLQDQLRKPHPMIQDYKSEIAYRIKRDQTLSKAKANSDYYQLAKSKFRADRLTLPIFVSESNLDRALKIMNSVITAIENFEGFTHNSHFSDPQYGYFYILHSCVLFNLHELGELKNGSKHISSDNPPRLAFKVYWEVDFFTKEIQSVEFIDNDSEKLENQVGRIVYKILEMVNCDMVYDIIREREKVREIENRKRQLIIKERREKELKEIEQLEKLSRNWEKAERIRQFADAIEIKFKQGEFIASEKRVRHLISWAREKADWLDPFKIYEDELMGKKAISILFDDEGNIETDD